jgi:deoxyribodipyrimidine photolyase-related protein
MNQGYRVTYIDNKAYKSLDNFTQKNLSDEAITEIHCCDPVDFLLKKRLLRCAKKLNIKLVIHESPNFINTSSLNEEFLGKEKKNYRLNDFYVKQRVHHQILTIENQPVGGSWSFDQENRKPLPKNHQSPTPHFPKNSPYVVNAQKYVEEHFSNNPGATKDFFYPVTFSEARDFLANFLMFRFHDFGPYQDALSEQPFLNHSLLSSSINCGLLTPKFVLEESIRFVAENAIPLNSLEGFIRQLIGWREFIRAIYERHGVKQRTTNFWKHDRKLDISRFESVEPFMEAHKKAVRFGYTHHIERLMVTGNFLLLAETHPDDVYTYFMTYFVDAYDWVMVPNVYGMSQFADGGMMSTKPYVSSANYLQKMGAAKKGDWTTIWTGLYWRFLFKNQDYFKTNHRTKMMVYQLNNKSSEQLKKYINDADLIFKPKD